MALVRVCMHEQLDAIEVSDFIMSYEKIEVELESAMDVFVGIAGCV